MIAIPETLCALNLRFYCNYQQDNALQNNDMTIQLIHTLAVSHM